MVNPSLYRKIETYLVVLLVAGPRTPTHCSHCAPDPVLGRANGIHVRGRRAMWNVGQDEDHSWCTLCR
jgi:hypothetical protein